MNEMTLFLILFEEVWDGLVVQIPKLANFKTYLYKVFKQPKKNINNKINLNIPWWTRTEHNDYINLKMKSFLKFTFIFWKTKFT